MHKLWDFSTKKHIYVINLDEMIITRKINVAGRPEFNVNNTNNGTKVSCKKLTVIDLIVPTYFISDFIVVFLNKISALNS
jgi:hypothetical protein